VRRALVLALACTAVGLAAYLVPGVLLHSASAKTTDGTLNCTVGPGFTISSDAANGLAPGTYTWSIHDKSEEHNCDLVGTGCSSSVELEGDSSCTVTLEAGKTYTFQCDAHPTQMKGSFTTAGGSSPPPPPPPPPAPPPVRPVKLSAKIGEVGPPTLKTLGGRKVTRLVAGKYTIVVKDTTAHHNFHLRGPGVNKTTGVAAKRTYTWTLTFRRGTYTYRDDAKPTVKKTVKVVPGPAPA
jgi:plastocyanin